MSGIAHTHAVSYRYDFLALVNEEPLEVHGKCPRRLALQKFHP